MQWTHPEMSGEIPPPLRAHTATLVDRKLVIFGGGQGAHYFDDVYVLDTTMRRWTKPNPARPDMLKPAPRRAHTAVYYRGKTWIFGGGNGMTALNDVWTLEITPANEYIWEPVKISGPKPSCRGYHTANLIGSIMVVVGGSDGKECFSDMWYLNLETLEWRTNKLAEPHRRLSHSATRVGSYLFIFGGHDGTEYLNDVLVGLQCESRQSIRKSPSPEHRRAPQPARVPRRDTRRQPHLRVRGLQRRRGVRRCVRVGPRGGRLPPAGDELRGGPDGVMQAHP